MTVLPTLLLLALARAPGVAVPHMRPAAPMPITAPANDSSDVAAAVSGFHRALGTADSAAVLAVLSRDVQIVESGEIETLDAYRAHHLPADIAYAQAVPASRRVVQLIVAGDVAWVTSTSDAHGTFSGRTVNSIGAETMILTRSPSDRRWLIRAIHWSSHRGS